MPIMRRAMTLARQPRARQWLAAEAFFRLLEAWAFVRFRSFHSYANRLGQPQEGEVSLTEPTDLTMLGDVRWAVESVNRTVGGRFTCLMQAMAAQAMLARRACRTSLVLGARLSRADDAGQDGEKIAAHAWLWAGGAIIVGAAMRGGYVPITSYVNAPPT